MSKAKKVAERNLRSEAKKLKCKNLIKWKIKDEQKKESEMLKNEQ